VSGSGGESGNAVAAVKLEPTDADPFTQQEATTRLFTGLMKLFCNMIFNTFITKVVGFISCYIKLSLLHLRQITTICSHDWECGTVMWM
jgi:hypothetical protein